MDARHPMSVLNSFSIKDNFYDELELRIFLFSCDEFSLVYFQTLNPMRAFITNILEKTIRSFMKMVLQSSAVDKVKLQGS